MKNKYILVIGCLAIFLTACTSGFEETNRDPYKLNEVPAKTMITPTVFNAHWSLNTKGWKVCHDLMQYTMQTNGNEAIHLYDVRNNDIEYLWTNLYRWANSADEMCRLAELQSLGGDKNDALAIGLTLRAWILFNLTDMFGSVPYTEAFKGLTENNYRPKYDGQESVYTGLLADLKRANSLFSKTKFTDATDKLYNGDVTKWQRFCNSLRVRYLLRASGKIASQAKAELTEIVSNPDVNPVFASVKDGAIMHFDVAPFHNKFYDVKQTEFSGVKRMCATLVDIMNRQNDPRRPLYMTLNNEAYVGIPSGVDQTEIDKWTSKSSTLSTNWQKLDWPFAIMAYSELQFALSEAALKGLVPGGNEKSETYYIEAVKAAFAEINTKASTPIADAEITAYLQQEEVEFDGTLKRIMEQKWVSLYFVGFESWSEFRRTGQPDFIKPGPAVKQAVMPTRFYYPDICKSSNKQQVDAGVALLGGPDDMTTQLWWAK